MKNAIDISEIVIYQINDKGEFINDKQMEFEFDDYTCNQFFFDNDNDNELLFFTATEIIRFKYKEEDADQEDTVYTLRNFLLDPPNFGVFNKT